MRISAVLDDLDKKIISYVCGGIYSYNDLAKQLGVSRATIYRRIERMEESDLITRMVMAVPNFTKLGLTAIIISLDISHNDKDRVIEFLKHNPKVKFLWRSYGNFNITTVIICNKGEEGDCISKLRHHLEEMGINIHKFEATVSFVWEKVNLNPY